MTRTLTGSFGLVLLLSSAPGVACVPPAATFGSGSHRLDAASLVAIDGVAAAWRRRPGQRIVLAAGADRVGPAELNMTLSRRRGEAVAAALARRGIPARIITVQALGETFQTADGVEESFHRRVWIELIDTPGCSGGSRALLRLRSGTARKAERPRSIPSRTYAPSTPVAVTGNAAPPLLEPAITGSTSSLRGPLAPLASA